MQHNDSHITSDKSPPDSTILKQGVEIEQTDQPAQQRSSYGQILKSSAIIGGSSMINILIGIVRTKFMAILLGPSGVGLMGLYTSITDLTQSIVGMGINSSGVRQIAESIGTSDEIKIAKTIQILRRTAIFLGLLGTVFLFSFAPQVSYITFDNHQHVNDIKLISIAIFFSLVSGGQSALIQGTRRISDLAWMSILGALLGATVSIITIYWLGQDGIALSLVLISAMTLSVSWWYSRKIKIQKQLLIKPEIVHEQIALLKLGFAFMISGLMMTITAYLVRMIIVREIGYDAAGLYQSAWALGGMYIGIILQAMGADFYPRLTAVAANNHECNRLVNEQTHIGILLATPGILATLTLAPLVIDIFYTAQFQGAAELLRWLCLGMSLRVISWPMGFIIMAKGAQNFLIISEFTWAFIYLILVWICIDIFKINGVGIAFFGSYAFHILINYIIAKRLSGFYITRENANIIFLTLSISCVVFIGYYTLNKTTSLIVGIASIFLISFYAFQEFLDLLEINKTPLIIKKLWNLFRLHSRLPNNSYLSIKDVNNTKILTSLSLIKTKNIIILYIILSCFLIMYNQYYIVIKKQINMIFNETIILLSN